MDDAEYRVIAPNGWLNLIADGLHNFTDGVVIAVAFARRGRSAGWATTWAALAHELPQEMGDYGLLRVAGFTDREALGFNFLSALVAVGATALTFVVFALARDDDAPRSASLPAWLSLFIESFAAGGFLAVTSSALYSAHPPTARRSLASVLRVALGFALAVALHPPGCVAARRRHT